MDRFDDFFAAHGLRCILLYYQEADVPVTGDTIIKLNDSPVYTPNSSVELQQVGLAPNQSKTFERRVTVTDGTEFPLTGMCVYFVRPNNIRPLSTSNIAEVSQVGCSLYLYLMHSYPLDAAGQTAY